MLRSTPLTQLQLWVNAPERPRSAEKNPGVAMDTKADVTEKKAKVTAYDLMSNLTLRQLMSASAIFGQEMRPRILEENPKASLQEITSSVEDQWKNLSEEEKKNVLGGLQYTDALYNMEKEDPALNGVTFSDPRLVSNVCKVRPEDSVDEETAFEDIESDVFGTSSKEEELDVLEDEESLQEHVHTSYHREIDGQHPRGRPKQRWQDTINADMKISSLRPNEAQDRAKWRSKIRRADPAPVGQC
ncbi:PMS1 protein, partial [Polyodon spathula]|nr:PMS1 protein [Polyodon spathula]